MESETSPALTSEQIRAVTASPSGAIRLLDASTNRSYVLVPADLNERVRSLAYDDSPWSDEEMDLLAAESADALGWDGMEAYQDPPS
jgi:hypothetical protein